MTDLQANITQLEALYEARHKTDHVFINWWVGTFVLGVLTGGLYLIYRLIKAVHRKNKYSNIIVKFYEITIYSINKLNCEQNQETILEDSLDLSEMLTEHRAIKKSDWQIILAVIISHSILFVICFIVIFLLNPTNPADIENYFIGLTVMLLIYTSPCWIILFYFEIFALFYLFRSLMKSYLLLDSREEQFIKDITSTLKKRKFAPSFKFKKQCQPRNFWLHLALTLPTLGLNWIYVDYRLTVEAQKRFAESARVQGAILQALKQLAEESTEIAS